MKFMSLKICHKLINNKNTYVYTCLYYNTYIDTERLMFLMTIKG